MKIVKLERDIERPGLETWLEKLNFYRALTDTELDLISFGVMNQDELQIEPSQWGPQQWMLQAMNCLNDYPQPLQFLAKAIAITTVATTRVIPYVFGLGRTAVSLVSIIPAIILILITQGDYNQSVRKNRDRIQAVIIGVEESAKQYAETGSLPQLMVWGFCKTLFSSRVSGFESHMDDFSALGAVLKKSFGDRPIQTVLFASPIAVIMLPLMAVAKVLKVLDWAAAMLAALVQTGILLTLAAPLLLIKGAQQSVASTQAFFKSAPTVQKGEENQPFIPGYVTPTS